MLPSKLFEYAALGKPIWAGVAGFTASFVTSEITNAAVFHPCNAEDALRAFERLQLRVANDPHLAADAFERLTSNFEDRR